MEQRPGCAFHSKRLRGSTQCVLNLLRAEGLLQASELKRVGRIICSCRENDSKPFQLSKLEDIQHWVGEIGNTTSNGKLQQQIRTLLKSFSSCQEAETCDEGVMKLLTVVQRVMKGDVSLLEHEKLPNKRGNQISAELDMPYHYVCFLVGKNGRHVRPLTEKYGVKKFHIAASSTYEKSSVSFVTQRSNQSEFVHMLQSMAGNVVQKREQHHKHLSVYYNRSSSWYEERKFSMHFDRPHVSPKEAAQCQFERKQANLKRSAKHHSTPILLNSRCLYCLMEYTPESKQCSFHPGFIVTKKKRKKNWQVWNCCGRRSIAGHATHEEHKRGCQVGLHNWRPCKTTGKRKMNHAWAAMQELYC